MSETSRRFRLEAVLCALALAVCAWIVHPVADIGIIDDWSYIKSAQVLAKTGHIVYNGWSNPMVGWQLFVGALFIKLFGFSFTTVRMAALCIGMATAFLVHRSFVRAGLREFNATVGTLSFVLSPIYLPLALTYMTDLFGLLAMVVCFYACLRALQATNDKTATLWICAAALLNALGGTARQVAWLGVLVMVPSTLWLLRSRRIVLRWGIAACAGGWLFVAASLSWYNRQVYSVQEHLLPERFNAKMLLTLAHWPVVGGLQLVLCIAPVLVLFLPALRKADRWVLAVVGAVAFATAITAALLAGQIARFGRISSWVVPGLIKRGALRSSMKFTELSIELHTGVRLALIVVMIAGLLGLVGMLYCAFAHKPSIQSEPILSPSRSIGVVLGPCTLAYAVLLIPRLSSGAFIDRYLLYFMWVALIATLLVYQWAVRSTAPRYALVFIAAMAAFVVADDHDVFALYRARAGAIGEMRSAGLPPGAIDGGPEFNAWSQVEAIGFLQQPGTRTPPGVRLPGPRYTGAAAYHRFNGDNTPLLDPAFALSDVPAGLEGPASFAPVSYHTWLAPHHRAVYILRYAAPLPR